MHNMQISLDALVGAITIDADDPASAKLKETITRHLDESRHLVDTVLGIVKRGEVAEQQRNEKAQAEVQAEADAYLAAEAAKTPLGIRVERKEN